MRLAIQLSCAAATLLTLAGCESTVDLARKIAKRGNIAFQQHGVSVARVDRRIHVLGTALITDANGTAVVVKLRSAGPKPMIDAPIAINIRDSHGKSVFRNDLPGSEEALTHVPLLLPGKTFDWINDQVQPSGAASRVAVRIGAGSTSAALLPAIELSGVGLTEDPVSGFAISGHVHNASRIPQVNLVVFATASRAGRIVSAGRAIVPHLLPGKTSNFHAYVIGNPRGAQLSVSVPPSVLS